MATVISDTAIADVGVIAHQEGVGATDVALLPARRSRPVVRRTLDVLSRLALPLFLVVLWQILCTTGVMDTKTLASPVQIAQTFWHLLLDGVLLTNLGVSLKRAGTGIVIGVPIGTALGLVAGLWRAGERALDSSMQMLRTLPFVALIPLVIVWFGIGETPKILLVSLGCVFPMYLNVYSGIRNVDNKLIESGRVLGLSQWGLIRHVVLPGALAPTLVGLRYALSISVLALVVAEQINANAGIGYLMYNAETFLETNVIFVGLIVYAMLGLAADLIVRALERSLLRGRQGFSGA
jgi:sulfonate transport system permease protein